MIDPAPFRAAGVRIALLSNTLTFFTLYPVQVAVAQYLQWDVGLSATIIIAGMAMTTWIRLRTAHLRP